MNVEQAQWTINQIDKRLKAGKMAINTAFMTSDEIEEKLNGLLPE